jgi:hypothetical protein
MSEWNMGDYKDQYPADEFVDSTEKQAAPVDSAQDDFVDPQSAQSGVDPLQDLQNKISTGSSISTSGVGPVKSGSEYARMVDPKGEKTRDTIASESESWGLGTAMRSAIQTAIPPADEAAARAYAKFYPEEGLTADQWYDVLRNRNAKYHEWGSKNPIPLTSWTETLGGIDPAVATDILGGAAVAAPVIAAGSAMGIPAAIGTRAAIGYGLATSPFVSEKKMNEPGYLQETTMNAVVGGVAPIAGPAIVNTAMIPVRAGSKFAGKTVANVMSKLAKTSEEAQIWKEWAENPAKYDKIDNPTKVITELYDDMSAGFKAIKEGIEQNKITEKEGIDALKALKTDYARAADLIKARAKDLGHSPAGTADAFEKQFSNFKEAVYSMYDDAWDAAPSTQDWLRNPAKFGIKIKDFQESMRKSLVDHLNGKVPLKGPEKSQIVQEADDLFWHHVNEMIDDAKNNGAISSGVAEFYKQNKQVIQNISDIDKIPTINRMTDTSVTKGIEVPVGGEKIFVPVKELINNYKYVATINPQSARAYSSSLFKRSNGFSSMQDQAASGGKLLSSDLGRKIAGSWRQNFLDTVSAKDGFQQFASLNKKAYQINNEFLKPLEKRFTVIGADKEATLRTFEKSARDVEPQIMNSVHAISRYGNKNDQTLLKLAERIKASSDAVANISSLDFESAIKHLDEMSSLRDEASNVLASLDPTIRKQYAALESLVLESSNMKKYYDALAKSAEEYAKNNKAALSMGYSGVEGALKKLGTGRAGIAVKPEQLSKASEGLKNIQMFMNDGDEVAANQAMDAIKKLREISLLNKRNVQGSRQTIQAGAIGSGAVGLWNKLTGSSMSQTAGAQLGIVANKFADEFTNKKWTKITPFLVEKMLNKKMLDYKWGFGNGIVSGQIARAIGQGKYAIDIDPESPDAMQAINILKNDKALNAQEKLNAIKKIKEQGIKLEL